MRRIAFRDSDRAAFVRDGLTFGPDPVHVQIIHGPGRPNDWAEGSIEDLGISYNLLTNVGRDLVAAGLGHAAGSQGAFTATTATSGTGSGWTTDQYKGWRVYCPVTGLTTSPVYGNIGSNTTTVLTLDQWWTATDGVGTTPAATNAYIILPAAVSRFMALTENAGAASAASTVLTGEITTGGCARALATYAHTGGTATLTLSKTFSVTASFPAIHKIGEFTASTSTAAGILVYETVLNADANVINGDSLAVTHTITVSG